MLVAMILLVVITLVGLAAIGTTLLQNKAAANQYDRQIALQAAEAAMRQAQAAITNATASQAMPVPTTVLNTAGFEDCSNVYNTPPTACKANPFSDSSVPAADIVTVPASAYSAGPAAATRPQYVVQYMGSFLAPKQTATQISNSQNYGGGAQGQTADYYRITARSGNPALAEGRAIVTLQSTFRN